MILINYLTAIPDPRRKQAQQYDLGSLLLFSIMAILSGATSYRKIERFIKARRKRLNKLCGINWKRAPAHNTIRYAFISLDVENMDIVFRAHAQVLTDSQLILGHIWISDEDGKKEHEIQAVQRLIQDLDVSDQLFTLDALYTQKNSGGCKTEYIMYVMHD